jgi:Sulfotransferase family
MQLDDLRNLGLVRMGDNCTPGAETTIVVVGVPRSGTSMVAAVLRQLGVHLGDETDTSVFEDRAIAAAIDQGDMEAFRKIVADNNSNHTVWGFKRPKALAKLHDIVRDLRNPRIVVTMRDCVAIAVRNSKSVYHDEIEGIRKAAQATVAALGALEGITCPVLMVSYEKAMGNPRKFTRQLAAFCGLTPSQEEIQAVVPVMKNGPELYLQNARLIYDGAFTVEGGRIRGWVMSNSAMPEIDVRNGTTLVASFRPDLPADVPAGYDAPPGVRFAGFDITLGEAGGDVILQVRNTVLRLRRAPPASTD